MSKSPGALLLIACALGTSNATAHAEPGRGVRREFGQGAQETLDPMAATVVQWFTMIEQSLISLADAMPAEKYDFKPTNSAFKVARTFGEQPASRPAGR